MCGIRNRDSRRTDHRWAGSGAGRRQGLGRRQAGPADSPFRRKGRRIRQLFRDGKPIAEIARVVGLSAAHDLHGPPLTRGSIWPGVCFDRPRQRLASTRLRVRALGKFFAPVLLLNAGHCPGSQRQCAKIVVSLVREPHYGRWANAAAAFQVALAISRHPISVPNSRCAANAAFAMLAGRSSPIGDGAWRWLASLPSPFMVGCPCGAGLGRLLPLLPWMASYAGTGTAARRKSAAMVESLLGDERRRQAAANGTSRQQRVVGRCAARHQSVASANRIAVSAPCIPRRCHGAIAARWKTDATASAKRL